MISINLYKYVLGALVTVPLAALYGMTPAPTRGSLDNSARAALQSSQTMRQSLPALPPEDREDFDVAFDLQAQEHRANQIEQLLRIALLSVMLNEVSSMRRSREMQIGNNEHHTRRLSAQSDSNIVSLSNLREELARLAQPNRTGQRTDIEEQIAEDERLARELSQQPDDFFRPQPSVDSLPRSTQHNQASRQRSEEEEEQIAEDEQLARELSGLAPAQVDPLPRLSQPNRIRLPLRAAPIRRSPEVATSRPSLPAQRAPQSAPRVEPTQSPSAVNSRECGICCEERPEGMRHTACCLNKVCAPCWERLHTTNRQPKCPWCRSSQL